MIEIWKDIKGYEGFYMASNTGRVKSLPRKCRSKAGSYRSVPERILKQSTDVYGYKVVVLNKYGRKSTKKVHRLIAKCFLPNPQKKDQVNHIDSDKTNNHVSNIEWSTPSENISHSYKAGTHKVSERQRRAVSLSMKGENSHKSKLTRKQVLSIREDYGNNELCIAEAARAHKVSESCISGIVHNRTWRHL